MNFQANLLLLTVLLISVIFSYQQTTPEERCATSTSGYVCTDCFTRGTCVDNGDGTYSTTDPLKCPGQPEFTFQSYCDDSIYDNTQWGTCSRLPDGYTICDCVGTTECYADPSNPSIVLNCSSGTPVEDPPCPSPAVDVTTCSCLTCTDPSCPLVDDPNDDCSQYYFCSSTMGLIADSCPVDTCFNQAECKCLEPTSTTAASKTASLPTGNSVTTNKASSSVTESTSGSGSTVESSTANSGPTGGPSTTGSGQTGGPSTTGSGQTGGSSTTDSGPTCGSSTTGSGPTSGSSTSGSGPTGGPSTESISSLSPVPQCPEDCPYADDPNDDCLSYYYCDGAVYYKCPSGLCYDKDLCMCTKPSTAKVGSTTAASVTCPADCPYVDDPNSSDCRSYFFCYNDELFSYMCPSELCFNQADCACIESGGTSPVNIGSTPAGNPSPTVTSNPNPPNPTTTQGPLTCSSDCPYVDDPNDDCRKYFYCDGGYLDPEICPGSLCFDQASCQCI